jgi:hypothetical protein
MVVGQAVRQTVNIGVHYARSVHAAMIALSDEGCVCALAQDRREAMKFTKPDLHLLVLCISAIVLFVVGGARASRFSNAFVPVYTGAQYVVGAASCKPQSPQSSFMPGNIGGRASICSLCFPDS